jgi:glycosyltransferase involved in cell wall biosynthesis
MKHKFLFIGGGLNRGGQERVMTLMANHFAEIGHDVQILLLFKTEKFFETNEDIKIFWPSIDRKKYSKWVYSLLLITHIRRFIKQSKPEVILSFGDWFNAYIIFVTRFLEYRLFVFDLMGPAINLGLFQKTSRWILYRFATGVVAQTKTAANIIKLKTGIKNVHIIPTPLSPINSSQKEKKKSIVTVGRLSPEKGFIYLIRAFSLIDQKEWTLHFVGDGKERVNLENEVIKLGQSEKIVFHGALKDFSDLFSESEIFVLSSLYEGFPNSLIEAMSVPLACISTNCVAGPSDIIKDGVNGMLVEPGNAEELAIAINNLIENPILRKTLAREAYKVRETLAVNIIAEMYLKAIFNK